MAQKKIIDVETQMILKERVWNHICHQPNGTSIGELEKQFGETRMRLGYIIQKLEEEGKIQKLVSTIIPRISCNQ
jgi:predicted transcriptional regulator